MLTSLIAAIALSAQNLPELEKKVSLKVPGLHFGLFAKALGEQVGIPVIATPDLGGISVYAHVEGKPVRELLDMVAYATTTEWVWSGDRITIRRTPAHEADEAARFLARRIAIAQKNMEPATSERVTLDVMVAQMKKALEISKLLEKDWDFRKYKELKGVDAIAPGPAVARAFADVVGIDVLAGIRPGERVVYSTHPTRLQRALPRSMNGAVADFNRLVAMAKQAREIAQVPEEYGTYHSDLLSDPFSMFGGMGNTQMSEAIVALHIILTHGRIEVLAYNETGDRLNQSSILLSSEERSADSPSFVDTGEKVVLAADTVQRGVLFSKLVYGRLETADRGEAVGLLARRALIQNQPTVLTAILDHWAERNGGLVAEIPNSTIPLEEQSEILAKRFVQRWFDDTVVERSEIHGVTVARAKNDSIRGLDIGEPAALVAEALLEKGHLDIEDWADVAGVTESDVAMQNAIHIGKRLTAEAELGFEHGFGVRLLRIYGRLPKTARKQVRESGREWTLNTLPASIKALVDQTVQEGAFAPGAAVYEPDRSWHEDPMPKQKVSLTDYEQEPTVLLTLAKAQPAVFRLDFLERPRIMVQSTNSDGMQNYQLARIDQLGQEMAIEELRRQNDPSQPRLLPQAYAEVTKGTLRGTLSFSAGFPANISFPVVMNRDLKFGPLSSLSKEVQAVIDADYRRALKQYENSDSVRPAGQGKPPPAH